MDTIENNINSTKFSWLAANVFPKNKGCQFVVNKRQYEYIGSLMDINTINGYNIVVVLYDTKLHKYIAVDMLDEIMNKYECVIVRYRNVYPHK